GATLGVAPEVITGDQEARLSFAGAVRGLSATPPYLVVDIGGGSTQFVRGAPPEGTPPSGISSSTVDAALSVDIGCVRMTERFLHTDPPTPAEVAAATGYINGQVDRALSTVDGRSAKTLVGLAGSVTTVTAIALGLPEYRAERIHHAMISTVD